MRTFRVILLTTMLVLQMIPALTQVREKFPLPAPGIPDSLGVNIHFNDPAPGEMEQLAAAGFRWIRQDFAWAGIERVKGQYDFSAYDRLMAHLTAHRIRPIFILDYGNDLYQKGSPRSPEAVAAFARFASASVTHFQGRGILWEMWNEPNGTFWTPKANVDEYVALALAVGKAIRAAAPDEWFIGPAVSGMDFNFLESCFRAGLLNYWDAVSFHPYRNSAPETAADDFLRVRALIARYGPAGKNIPMISGEWGYSELYPGLNLDKQSKYIAREFLSNMANGLLLTIWYDWHDDGTDPKEPEHHFGTVTNEYKPKPTYTAVKTLAQALDGFTFNKRLILDSPQDYCLLFSKGQAARLAVWTTAMKPHEVRLPVSSGSFKIVDYLGAVTEQKRTGNRPRLLLTDAPQYITPSEDNALLSLALRWNTLPPAVALSTPNEAMNALRGITFGQWTAADPMRQVTVGIDLSPNPAGGAGMEAEQKLGTPQDKQYPLAKFLQDVGLPYHSDLPYPVTVHLHIAGMGTLAQQMVFIGRDPFSISAAPGGANSLAVTVGNPTGAPFHGRLRLAGQEDTQALPLDFARGETSRTVLMPVHVNQGSDVQAGVLIEQRFSSDAHNTLVSWTPVLRYRPLGLLAGAVSALSDREFKVVADGDPKVASQISAQPADAPSGLPAGKVPAVRIDYNFAPGWKFLRVEPLNSLRSSLPGSPYALGMWVYGDKSGDILNARFTDTTGQTFQPTAGRVDWQGWRYIQFRFSAENSGHWGGVNDGVIHFPIHLDTVLLVDSPDQRGGNGTLHVAQMTLMSDPKVVSDLNNRPK